MKAIIIFLVLTTTTITFVDAREKPQLKDIGVIGLASHDMFTWNHRTEKNEENGRLDLSTIFDYADGKRWQEGGNPKNAENAPVWTITQSLVSFYKAQIKNGRNEKAARLMTVKHFHQMVKSSYERLMGMKFPTNENHGKVTNAEQAVMRALHDILPGKVKLVDRKGLKDLTITDYRFAKFILNKKELEQTIADYDGKYDPEYNKIKLPHTRRLLNLEAIDKRFIKKFSQYNQKEMLKQLKDVGEGKEKLQNIKFMKHISELFSKGMSKKDNIWIQ